MNEKTLELKLREGVKKLGGLALKYTSSTHTGMPDRLVLMPGEFTYFVELKSTGKKPTRIQEQAIKQLEGLNYEVWVIDTQDKLTEFLKYIAE